MAGLMLIVGKVIAVLLAVGAGLWYARIGLNWSARLVGPLALSFVAFIVGSFTFGDPTAGDSFQPQVWLVMSGGVLAGVAVSKLVPNRSGAGDNQQRTNGDCEDNDNKDK